MSDYYLIEAKPKKRVTLSEFIVFTFDLLVAAFIGFGFFPNLHIVFRFLISFGIFTLLSKLMDIRKFKIGLIFIAAYSVLFAFVVDQAVIVPDNDKDIVWTWTIRIVSFWVSFIGHYRLNLWDEYK